MKRKVFGLLAVMMFCTTISADPTESGVPTSPLVIYSGGISVGAIKSLNDSLKLESKSFFKLSFINDIYLTDPAHLFIDADWLAPRANFGLDVGFDYFLVHSKCRPFVGAGIGVRHFDKKKDSFGDNIGPSGTVHAGMMLELSDMTQMRFRVPFHVVLNKTSDMGVGVEIGLLFSKPYRNVKKLNY